MPKRYVPQHFVIVIFEYFLHEERRKIRQHAEQVIELNERRFLYVLHKLKGGKI